MVGVGFGARVCVWGARVGVGGGVVFGGGVVVRVWAGVVGRARLCGFWCWRVGVGVGGGVVSGGVGECARVGGVSGLRVPGVCAGWVARLCGFWEWCARRVLCGCARECDWVARVLLVVCLMGARVVVCSACVGFVRLPERPV